MGQHLCLLLVAMVTISFFESANSLRIWSRKLTQMGSLVVAMSMWQPPVMAAANDLAQSGTGNINSDLEAMKVVEDLRRNGGNEVSANVPTRTTRVALDPKDSVISSDDSIAMQTMKLIPSYKYFKAISKEYSSRSTDYEEGKENLFAPFQ